jgi:hypothetical protein
MFAGLPGIGVGTLFYILTALWMPFRELGMLVTGRSSVARWRLVGTQVIYACSVILSIMVADRVLLWVMGGMTPGSFSPALLLHRELGSHAPHSIMAAPIMASILLLGGVLLVVELSRVYHHVMDDDRVESTPSDLPEPLRD